MIDALNTAMLELQSAFTTRALYPPSHPKIRKGERRAFELLREVTRQREAVMVFAVGERVIHEGETLAAGPSLIDGLFGALRARGADRVTFRRGLDEEEIRRLLDALVADETERPGGLKATPHIGLGFIRESELEATEEQVVPLPGEAPLPAQLASVLRDVWQEVSGGSRLRSDILGDVVFSLTRALTDSSGAMLPLASVKQHDEYTFVHTINVAMLSTALGEAMGFKERMTHELNMAALLHDVGKQLIPLELLNKSGKFTDEEFRIVQLHPVDGARMLLATPGVPELSPVVAFEHHIRADGTGYPRVPRGWKLNLASRIVQVADVFDALRTHRPYRRALPLGRIFEIMRSDVGTMFDADILEIFFRSVVSRGIPEPEKIARGGVLAT